MPIHSIPVIIDFYRETGFRPEAVLNYLLPLGWSLDDKTEDFTREQMIESFSLERVNKSPASFDPQKLVAFQARDMQALPLEQKLTMVMPYLQKAGYVSAENVYDDAANAKVEKIVRGADHRLEIAGDILDYADFFTPDDELDYDEKAFQKRLRKPEKAAELLSRFRELLADAETFDSGSLDKLLHDFVDAEGIKIGDVIHAIRVAVTGKPVGFGMFETLEILGQPSCLRRIDRALSMLS